MKKLFLAFSACLVLSGAMAQNKVIQDKNAQVRSVKDFHAIRVSNGIHLYLSQGNEEAVAVSATDPEYRNHIITEVTNGVLKIYFDKNGRDWDDRDRKRLRAYVSCKVLDELKGNSGANVEVDGSIKSNELAMDFTSGANFNGDVRVTKLKMQQNSGAETNISGTAVNCTIEASSGASFKGYDLATDNCDANTSSGADLRITVNKELSASASSGGQIHYKGNGVIKEINTSSGGEVSKR
ncbi:MAG: DUF2807 domain-containing protein [Bacteroidetes bacterium]|nr:DUF2807 domain-containing protein [Bacteroidota bacterium]